MEEISILERLLTSDEGYGVLLAIRELHYGKLRQVSEVSPKVIDILYETDIIHRGQSSITFTSHGYIFSNICKEYCNWVENNRYMPPPKPPVEFFEGKTVLDLGCSIGRWLWEFEKAKKLIGIEMEKAYVEAAKVLSKKESKNSITIINASVEDIRDLVQPNTIDFAFSRLVFNHVYIDATLSQTYNSLVEGGKLWLHVENYRFPLSQLIGPTKVRGKIRALFSILNTLVYMTIGKQICLKLKGRMHEYHKTVYPSSRTWRKALQSTGFLDISIQKLPYAYILVASK